MIIEQAGGKAISEQERILDIVPRELHQRTPLIIGSSQEVDLVQSFIKG
jgi:fructose-1,6-bisphosphatase I